MPPEMDLLDSGDMIHSSKHQRNATDYNYKQMQFILFLE